MDTERYNNRFKIIQSYGFKDLVSKLYHSTRTFSANDYLALLNTYSDHRSMTSLTRKRFENEWRDAILEFGNELKVYDTIDLYLARKSFIVKPIHSFLQKWRGHFYKE